MSIELILAAGSPGCFLMSAPLIHWPLLLTETVSVSPLLGLHCLLGQVYDRAPRAIVYVPYLQSPNRFMDVGVHTAGDPTRLVSVVTAAIHSQDAELPISKVMTMTTAMHHPATSVIRRRCRCGKMMAHRHGHEDYDCVAPGLPFPTGGGK